MNGYRFVTVSQPGFSVGAAWKNGLVKAIQAGQARTNLRIIEGRPWQHALICALRPEAPYRPWRGIGKVARGDAVLVVLDTDPRTVLCGFTWNGRQDVRHDIGFRAFYYGGALPSVSEIEAAAGVPLTDRGEFPIRAEAAEDLLSRVRGFMHSPQQRAGRSPVVIGRLLLNSRGCCACCGTEVMIRDYADVDRMVHTVSETDLSARLDWPALVCDACTAAMRDGGFTSVVAFVYSQRPACPACSARAANAMSYGKASGGGGASVPWAASGGCVSDSDSPKWVCARCGHGWGHYWTESASRR